MIITEPMTMVTDYVLAVVCIVFAILTMRMDQTHRARALWTLTFLAGAVAAGLGGTHHGFKLTLGPSADKQLWDATMAVIGASGALILSATIVSSLRNKKASYVRWLIVGLTCSVLGLVIQMIGWDIDPRFNHNDLFHIVQIVGFWCFYQGVRRLA